METYSCITGPVDSDRFEAFWTQLPDTIFRAKGIVCIKESKKGEHDELRVAFHKVGKRWDMEFTRPWEEDEKKEMDEVKIDVKETDEIEMK